MYQSLDAIDGYVPSVSHLLRFSNCVFLFSKQARRTGMSGPLGEMFDHGMRQPSSSIPVSDVVVPLQDVTP